jgi:PAS domain S-box-containing protein
VALHLARRSAIGMTPKARRGRSDGSSRPSFDDNLAKSQARLINIVDSVTDAIIATHADGCILLFNAAAERIFRCSAADALGEPIGRFLPDAMPPASDDRRFHIIQARRGDGEPFRAEATITRIEVAGDNLCTIIVRDVSERWRTEELLRKLSRAVEQSADGICITDARGTIEYVNAAFEALIGLPRHELMGRNRATLREPQAERAKVHIEESVTPIRDNDGNVTHFVIAARDMTRHVRTEDALRRINESLEEQARRIAQTLHDEAGQFLTAAHIALADAVRELPEPSAERLQSVRDHLDRIEDQLRRLAHELHPRILDDLGLVTALQFLALGFEKRRGIPVIVECALQTRLHSALEIAVYRLVQEALSNASKHARARRVVVRLEQSPGALRCSVADDGIGLDAAALEARLAAGESSMGLSGIRDRVEGLGGTLHIESAPGRGTRLSILVPEP